MDVDYITIKKRVEKYNVLITNNPLECERADGLPDDKLVVYCVHENKWCSFIIPKKLLIDTQILDGIIYNSITHKFTP